MDQQKHESESEAAPTQEWLHGPLDPPRPEFAQNFTSAKCGVVHSEPMAGAQLHCPVRGLLKVTELAKSGLQFTEEKRRIDCIKFLLAKGYPADHIQVETVLLRFGHKGHNSFRTDLAVFDIPTKKLPQDVEGQKEHIRLVAEIKRDNADAKLAKQTQVKPAMDFLPDQSALGMYWDDVEQRLFYKKTEAGKTKTRETAAALLPPWGKPLGVPKLTSGDLRPTNLRVVFEKIEDRLHPEVPDGSARFEIMLQLLLAKLYDEHTHRQPKQAMTLQDFTDAPLPDATVKTEVEKLLTQAVAFYGKYLPKEVSKKIGCNGAMARSLTAILAPVSIFGSKRAVVQDFYMYFAQGVYRWDMAQYFTPTEVVDFIVALVNPQAGDQVKDPACGSGDFLISALHYAQRFGGDVRDSIWGADNSPQAVQVCILNMVLNGDGKSNICKEDSLMQMAEQEATYSVLLCNPPFGIRIVEKRFAVLRHFDLGHEWKCGDDGHLAPSEKVLKSQETGLLFAELCVRQTEAGGRIGIIMPNGYLGNRSMRYLAFREWLLRHTRLVAVIGFPRFTFKKSGADVSASVLVLERREDALAHAVDSEDYPFHAGLLESVGWSAGDKRAEAVYRRDVETGELVLDPNNEPILDADFDRALNSFRSSTAADGVAWSMLGGVAVPAGTAPGHSLNIREVLARPDISIDPKRWCERCVRVRKEVMAGAHFKIDDIVKVVDEIGVPDDRAGIYKYIQIDDIADGAGMPTTMRGWQLPDRAKHGASQGDVFVGGIWSSVDKWFVASGDCENMRVTNGCRRLRLKPGKEAFLLDLVAGLNTETYRIQARAFCTGSDGLADLSAENLREIVLPRITNQSARSALQPYVDKLLAGRSTVASAVTGLVADGSLSESAVPTRSSHMVQV